MAVRRKQLKLALIQSESVPAAAWRNVTKRLEGARRALEHGARLLVFPDLCLCGCETPGAIDCLGQWTELETALLELSHAATVVVPGQHLACTGLGAGLVVFDKGEHKLVQPEGEAWFTLLESPDARLAFASLEAALSANAHPQAPKEAGAQLLVVYARRFYYAGTSEQLQSLLELLVERTGLPLAYVNGVGLSEERLLEGASRLLDCEGTVQAVAPAFSEAVLVAGVSLARKPSRRSLPLADVEVTQPLCKSEPVRPPAGALLCPTEEEALFCALASAVRAQSAAEGVARVAVLLTEDLRSQLALAIAAEGAGKSRTVALLAPLEKQAASRLKGLAKQLGVPVLDLPVNEGLGKFGPGRFTTARARSALARRLQHLLAREYGWLVLEWRGRPKAEPPSAPSLFLFADATALSMERLARYVNLRFNDLLTSATLHQLWALQSKPDEESPDLPHLLPNAELQRLVKELFPPLRLLQAGFAEASAYRQRHESSRSDETVLLLKLEYVGSGRQPAC